MTLTSALSTSLAGMQAQSARLAGVSDNVANSGNPDYRRNEIGTQSLAGGGATAVVEKADQPGPDAASDMMDMIDAEMSFRANLAAFETGADMWDALLAIKRD